MPDELIETIDARIAAAKPSVTRMGTVVRAGVDAHAGWGIPAEPTLVLLDGDAVAVPVKAFALVRANDRAGCVKFGSDWVVVGTYSPNQPAHAFTANQSLSAGTTTSTTGAALPGATSVRFRKDRNDSYLIFTMNLNGIYATVTPTTGYAVANVVGDPGTGINTALDVAVLPFAVANSFDGVSGQVAVPINPPTQNTWPAGWYTISPYWRRSASSTGTLTCEARSSVALRIEEVRPY